MGKRKSMSKARRKRRRQLVIKGILLILFLGGLTALIVGAWYQLSGKSGTSKITQSYDVCIDPGHGGNDPGANQGNRIEKEDNLSLALLVKEALEQDGLSVLLTREDDTQVSLQARCEMANEANAKLFVSLHRNAAKNTGAGGVEIWTAKEGGIGEQMASGIMERLETVGIQNNRGVQIGTKDGEEFNYYVNKHTKMPSCLVEMGFLTNEEDNRLLEQHEREYAVAIADAIAETFAAMKETD